MGMGLASASAANWSLRLSPSRSHSPRGSASVGRPVLETLKQLQPEELSTVGGHSATRRTVHAIDVAVDPSNPRVDHDGAGFTTSRRGHRTHRQ